MHLYDVALPALLTFLVTTFSIGSPEPLSSLGLIYTHTGLRLIRSNILSHTIRRAFYSVIIEKGGGRTEGLPPVLRDEHGSSKQEG